MYIIRIFMGKINLLTVIFKVCLHFAVFPFVMERQTSLFTIAPKCVIMHLCEQK